MNPSPESQADGDRAVLVADLGCSLYRGLAEAAAEISKGRVVLRDIAAINLPTAVTELLKSKTEPLLYREVPGKVEIWRGLRLRLQLARLIGPADAARLLAQVVRAPALRQTIVGPITDAGNRLTRRQVLRSGSAVAVGAAVLGLFPRRAANASTPSQSSTPRPSRPLSQGDAGVPTEASCR